jgi:D-alanine-D-alanine ligase
MKIIVLLGGFSPERDVSIESGRSIFEALKRLGHQVIAADYGSGYIQDEIISLDRTLERNPPETAHLRSKRTGAPGDFFMKHHWREADLVFNALHGGEGEDGTIQGYLDFLNLRYTGSDLLSSAMAMSKHVSKLLFRAAGIPTPRWVTITVTGDIERKRLFEDLEASQLRFPLAVKPNSQGSTVGFSIAENREELIGAIAHASRFGTKVLCEKFIEGREITVAILGDKALPVVEILPKGGVYDYECKYTEGMSQYRVPAELPAHMESTVKQNALKAFDVLGCRGYARVDFRLDEAGCFYCLEVNTLPGMTSTSLVPKAAKAAGVEFDTLIDTIAELALC